MREIERDREIVCASMCVSVCGNNGSFEPGSSSSSPFTVIGFSCSLPIMASGAMSVVLTVTRPSLRHIDHPRLTPGQVPVPAWPPQTRAGSKILGSYGQVSVCIYLQGVYFFAIMAGCLRRSAWFVYTMNRGGSVSRKRSLISFRHFDISPHPGIGGPR